MHEKSCYWHVLYFILLYASDFQSTPVMFKVLTHEVDTLYWIINPFLEKRNQCSDTHFILIVCGLRIFGDMLIRVFFQSDLIFEKGKGKYWENGVEGIEASFFKYLVIVQKVNDTLFLHIRFGRTTFVTALQFSNNYISVEVICDCFDDLDMNLREAAFILNKYNI